mmetsp:Transcript_11040/g.38950  ORF Transcript_11040/g.38950 Transcript_11040/m.38950 type:complete len:209 (-) Transcript_11040:2643-3269(-)
MLNRALSLPLAVRPMPFCRAAAAAGTESVSGVLRARWEAAGGTRPSGRARRQGSFAMQSTTPRRFGARAVGGAAVGHLPGPDREALLGLCRDREGTEELRAQAPASAPPDRPKSALGLRRWPPPGAARPRLGRLAEGLLPLAEGGATAARAALGRLPPVEGHEASPEDSRDSSALHHSRRLPLSPTLMPVLWPDLCLSRNPVPTVSRP